MVSRQLPARLAVAVVIAVSGGVWGSIARADEAAERDFTLKVLPLLKAKCFACHGDDPEKVKGGLDVRSREALLKGGTSEEAGFVPGDPEDSLLYLAVKWDGLEMPPKENDRLTEEEVALVGRWIAAGAPWPDEAAQRRHREEEWAIETTADGVIVKTSGGLADQWTYRRYKPEDLWAFRPVKQPALPRAAVNPIDAFIEDRLEQAGASMAPQADPRTLIRRATFDLIGLPPSPEDVDAFLKAWQVDSGKAWTELVDRLLDSPHYGERWAQHWLDVTRYADTGGMANDFERSNMWRYRDYVIRALNDDKPYDRFIVEQLAGDLLADASVRQRLGSDEKVEQTRETGDYTAQEAEWLVATGYLRMGPWDNAMVKDEEAQQIYRDDLVNNVGQTFLATTSRCFKCHDHKFDPLPTRDYYRLYAAVSGLQMAERPLRFLPEESQEGFAEGRAFVERMLDFARVEKSKIVDKRETAARQWFEEHGLEYKPEGQRTALPDEAKPPRSYGLDHVEEGQLKVREQDEWIWERALERYEPMIQSVYDGPDPKFAYNSARKLRMPKAINTDWSPETHILMGGSIEAPGEVVKPGVLSAIGLEVDGEAGDPYVLPEDLASRRLGLANWVADERNSLATRSIVNRVWQYHFGKPLVATPNNFGVKGAKPTHPELLDWLTADFVEHGRTLKRMHGLVMTSKAYQQDSDLLLAPKPPMFPARAKNVIMLFMEGGPGHMDTFDPKPKLSALHKAESKLTEGQETGFKFFVGSPFKFKKVGQSGIEMCDQWEYLADPFVADELCNYRGCQAESLNHPEALFHMNTGSRLGADPALGAWTTYGLGTENQNLPGYVVMTELAFPQGGSRNWSNGFLPANYQGTRLRPEGSPILDLDSQPFKSREHQRRFLDEMAFLNDLHVARHPEHRDLAARMDTYELAHRMQMEVPDVIDLKGESATIRQMYGLDDDHTAAFGRQCLLARRLVEKGVRFVQIFSGGWDSHDYLERAHTERIRSVDKPIAALIRDLKQRGMLEDTLVIWTGEFGRTPDNNKRGGVYSLGRGHNANAMTMLFAGGGVKKGSIVGATDELGLKAVDVVHPIRDLHVTLLHLLGLDDNKLTYFHGGRYKQLSQFGGQVIKELIA